MVLSLEYYNTGWDKCEEQSVVFRKTGYTLLSIRFEGNVDFSVNARSIEMRAERVAIDLEEQHIVIMLVLCS